MPRIKFTPNYFVLRQSRFVRGRGKDENQERKMKKEERRQELENRMLARMSLKRCIYIICKLAKSLPSEGE